MPLDILTGLYILVTAVLALIITLLPEGAGRDHPQKGRRDE